MSTNPSESGLNHKNGDLEEGFVFATLKAPMRCFSSKKTTEPKNSQRVIKSKKLLENVLHLIWSNYSDLTRVFTQNGVFFFLKGKFPYFREIWVGEIL